MPMRDPRIAMGIAGIAGGSLVAMATIFTMLFSPAQISTKTVAQAVVLTFCSALAGFVGAYYVGGAIVYAAKIQAGELQTLISLMVGFGFWNAVPGLARLSERYNLGAAARLLPGMKNGGGDDRPE